jgi:hypothetical protein
MLVMLMMMMLMMMMVVIVSGSREVERLHKSQVHHHLSKARDSANLGWRVVCVCLEDALFGGYIHTVFM